MGMRPTAVVKWSENMRRSQGSIEALSAPDLPGFYYDSERGRYFRLPPAHFSHLPQYTCITSQQQDKPTPQKRKPIKESVRVQHNISSPWSPPQSLFQAVSIRQYGVQLQDCPHRTLHERLLCSMQQRSSPDFLASHSSITSHKDMTVNESGELLAILYTCTNSTVLKVLKLHTDKDGELRYRQLVERRSTPSAVYGQPGQKIEFRHHGNREQLLAVQPCDLLHRSSKVLQFDFSGEGMDAEREFLVIKKTDICTAAWNHNLAAQDSFIAAVSCSSGRTYLIREGERPYRHSISSSSSVFAQVFAHQDPVLYTGHRSGLILAHDLRSRSRQHVVEPKYAEIHSSVIRLHPLQDKNYLISNAFNSRMGIWDLRMGRKVWVFSGHTNTVQHCQSLVDRNESVLAAVGRDRCIRLWSIRAGNLLRTIDHTEYTTIPVNTSTTEPAEYAAPPASSGLPVVCYSDTLGGHRGYPGLVIAIGEQVSVFRL